MPVNSGGYSLDQISETGGGVRREWVSNSSGGYQHLKAVLCFLVEGIGIEFGVVDLDLGHLGFLILFRVIAEAG